MEIKDYSFLHKLREICPSIKDDEDDRIITIRAYDCYVQVHKETINLMSADPEYLAEEIWEKLVRLDKVRKNGKIN